MRKNGFSKDNKSQQPQILIALMVSKEGLPIAYEVFSGNTFEGKTFIPMIQSFIRNNKVGTLTVVADAAMISIENSTALNEKGINFIVGARLGNISSDLLSEIDSKIVRKDGKSIQIKTAHGELICGYCHGCIQEAEAFMKDNIENNDILFILTKISSIKILQQKIGIKVSEQPNVYIDKTDDFSIPTDNSIYPCIIKMEKGQMLDHEFQSPKNGGAFAKLNSLVSVH